LFPPPGILNDIEGGIFLSDFILNYLSTLGLAGLVGGVFIESMGLPFPGGIMVILTGLLVNQGRLQFSSAMMATLVGYTGGSLTAYLIGRNLGQPFFTRMGSFLHISPGRFEQAQSWLDRSAPAFIVFGRFLPGLSNLTPYMAGVSRISLLYFLFYNSIFALGWGILYLLLGMFFGHNYQVIAPYINTKLPLVGLALLASYLAYVYIRRFLRSRVKNQL
jgi:membrane protein DedA with SNARE-associated domain